ncbi:nitrogen regulatory protein P-II family [Desulfacinum infernum DSM 9756]|jgi:nitrogen regulatory protein PII 1|uniref:Nitrogen regulatory protein P-II family n=1 Tax=Desulfacinum infernum DSM 9756 TaxID=1121391 RepID=A0A1M5HTP7_9BACT|nr:P-II family nitrogen regulator [Desulfacinum infernum]MBZ4658334.1 nitrogen regulatory protein [Desulfacinum sp.]SHG19303.1 nitrogen regulatory protein P-II family [Desulfacinum infernum DSM 9756]
MLVMVRAVIRPEKTADVMQALLEAGYPAVTRMEVAGRGKQRGLKLGNVVYDELPKDLLLMVVPESDKEFVVRTIVEAGRTGEKGAFGDGKIFVTPVEESYTIRTGERET